MHNKSSVRGGGKVSCAGRPWSATTAALQTLQDVLAPEIYLLAIAGELNLATSSPCGFKPRFTLFPICAYSTVLESRSSS